MLSVLQIEQAIADLPEMDRSYLAKKILGSFEHPEKLTKQEQELLDHRSSEMRTGAVQGLSLSELKNRMSQ